jgi:ribosomal protein L4
VETIKDKVLGQKWVMVRDLEIAEPRTRLVKDILTALKLEKPLFVVEQKSRNLLLASRNLSNVAVKTALEINALDVASHRECLVSQGAYKGLLGRLKAKA